jgi:hypothetical protein
MHANVVIVIPGVVFKPSVASQQEKPAPCRF